MLALIDKGNQTIVVYPQVLTTDVDGNPVYDVSATGTSYRARVQPDKSEEERETGYNTVERYWMRIARGADPGLGIGAEVEWDGKRWQVDGFPQKHTGSPRTRRNTYHIRRA